MIACTRFIRIYNMKMKSTACESAWVAGLTIINVAISATIATVIKAIRIHLRSAIALAQTHVIVQAGTVFASEYGVRGYLQIAGAELIGAVEELH